MIYEKKQFRHLNIALTVFLSLTFCCGQILSQDGGENTEKGNVAENNQTQTVNGTYLIKPGDILDILVLNRPQFSRSDVRVDEVGTIKMPFIDDEVMAKCRTARQLADNLAKRFDEMLYDPQVDVLVKEHQTQSVAFLGAVKSPSRLELQRRQSVNLLELLAIVGGPAENAGNSIQIIHANSSSICSEDAVTTDQQDINTNFYKLKDALAGNVNPVLRSGDIVILQEADQAFVIGNVLKPSVLLLQDSVTVTQAIAMAGGTLPDTNRDRLKIIRQIPGSTKKMEITVDLEAIAKQKAEDLLLEPNDILTVPVSGKKRLFKTFLGSIIPSLGQLPVRVIP